MKVCVEQCVYSNVILYILPLYIKLCHENPSRKSDFIVLVVSPKKYRKHQQKRFEHEGVLKTFFPKTRQKTFLLMEV